MEQQNGYTPEETALKAEIDALAQSIHPDANFVADLQAWLMQKEAMASTQFNKKRFSLRSLALIAVLMMIPSVIILFYLANDRSETVTSQEKTWIAETEIAAAATPTEFEIDFSSTAMPPIRATATMPAVRMTTTPVPSTKLPPFSIELFRRWLNELLKWMNFSPF